MKTPAATATPLAQRSSSRSLRGRPNRLMKSTVAIVEIALMEESSEDIAAARQAEMIRPATPGGRAVRM